MVFVAYRKFYPSRQNQLLFLIVTTTLIGLYVAHYSFVNVLIPLTIIFIIPAIGFPKVMYLDFVVRLWSIIFTILILGLFATDNVYNPVMHYYKLGLGFGNPNTLGLVVLGMLMELVLVNNLFPRKIYIFIWLSALPALFVSHSRTAIWSLVIFCAMWLLVKHVNLEKNKILKWLLILMPFILLAISLLFTLWYKQNANNLFVKSFDLFTSNRLKLSDYFFKEYGLSFFGKNITDSKYVLDMGYISLLLRCGIFTTFMILSMYALTIKKFIDLKNYQFVAPLTTVLFAMIPEGLYGSIACNPFMLCCVILFSQYNNAKKLPAFVMGTKRLEWGMKPKVLVEIKHADKPYNKWVIAWSAILAITLVYIKPNINNYIYGNNLKPVKVTTVKSTFTEDFAYRKGSPEGIVVHETTDKNVSAPQEVKSFLKTWKKREAYVHTFVDKDQIIQIHPTNRAVWGAGKYANERFIQVELCEENTPQDFAQSVLNDANYIANLLHKYHLKPVLENGYNKGTIWSHDDVSKYLGNTDHTDPIGYFAKHNYSMQDFFELIKLRYYHKTPKINYLAAKLPLIQSYIVLISIVLLIILFYVDGYRCKNKSAR